eukprot:scaffold30733_cov129-Isochrysis_galbana.AAC.9
MSYVICARRAPRAGAGAREAPRDDRLPPRFFERGARRLTAWRGKQVDSGRSHSVVAVSWGCFWGATHLLPLT